MSAATATASTVAGSTNGGHGIADDGDATPTTETRARSDFDAYLAQCAAHGRPNLHIELKEAKRRVAEFGGYSILTQALGFPRTAIVEAGGIGVLPILPITTEDKARYFTPAGAEDNNSQLALIVPCWEPDMSGDLTDLLAVRLDRPAQFLVRNGYAKVLGAGHLDEVRAGTTLWALPDDEHPAAILSPNPLTWLRGDCQGAVILHEAWLTYALTGIRSVVAHNDRHAKALHRLLNWPGAPKIFLHEKR